MRGIQELKLRNKDIKACQLIKLLIQMRPISMFL